VTRLGDLGEHEILGALRRIFEENAPPPPAGFLGIGDDAAMLPPPAAGRSLLVTVDALVEGTHFERSYAPARFVGRKAAAVNISDIAAMGGRPRYALLALSAPGELPWEWLEEFAHGFAERMREFDIRIAGGNLAGGERFSATVTVLGDVETGRAVSRAGGCPGDRLFLTGPVGASALGLAVLRGEIPAPPEPTRTALITAHLDPAPRVREGALAAHYARAMIDLSDGLLVDLGHLCAESGCGAEIVRARLPHAPEWEAFATARAGDASRVWLEGGEDYELLFAVPPSSAATCEREAAAAMIHFFEIGCLTQGSGIIVVGVDGAREVVAPPRGFEHFR
jgi:thiamine-monophosphate kinase